MYSSRFKVCAIKSLIVLHMDKASRPAYVRVVDTVFWVRVFALVYLMVTRDTYYHWEYNKDSTSPPCSGQTRLDVVCTQRLFASLGGLLDLLLGSSPSRQRDCASLIGFLS